MQDKLKIFCFIKRMFLWQRSVNKHYKRFSVLDEESVANIYKRMLRSPGKYLRNLLNKVGHHMDMNIRQQIF